MRFKDQKWSKGAHFEQSRFWERKRGKMGEKLGFARMSDFGGSVSHFMLLRDQATWKRRFEVTKVRKQNPNFIFLRF